MARAELQFELTGEDGSDRLIDAEDFGKFCLSVLKCLRRSEAILGEGQSPQIRYVVSDLKCGSAKVQFRAVRPHRGPDHRLKVLRFFKNTVHDIQRGRLDPRMQPDDLLAFAELAEPLKHGIKPKIGATKLTEKYLDHLQAITVKDELAKGFVTGVLDRLDLHDNKNEIVIFPPIGGPITCRFSEDQTNAIRSALKRNVTVRGTLHYRPGKIRPYRVDAEHMRIHERDADLPTLHDVRAFGRWDTGGLDAVGFVRSLREGDDAA